MKRVVLVLIAVLMSLGFLFSGVASAKPGQEVCPSGDGWVKYEAGYGKSVTQTAPEGQLIAESCVKAAQVVSYDEYDPAVASVVLNSPATNNNGRVQDISHYSIRLVPVPVVVPTKPEPVVTETVTFEVDCDARLVYSTTTTTTTDFVLVDNVWVPGEPVVVVVEGERRATNIECPIPPQPDDIVTVVEGPETLSCDSGEAYRQVTTTTITFYAADGFWFENEPVVTVEEVSRPMTDAEIAACPDERDPVYENCDEVRALGLAPIFAGDPGFRAEFDGDGDGIGCEIDPVLPPVDPEVPETPVVEPPVVTPQAPVPAAPVAAPAAPVVSEPVEVQPLSTNELAYTGDRSFIIGGMAVLSVLTGGLFLFFGRRKKDLTSTD